MAPWSLVLCAIGLPLASALPTQKTHNSPIQSRIDRPYPPPAERAQAVVDAFRFSWDGYYKYAFPNDELKSYTNGSSNTRNGWGASAVDGLDTALIMGEAETVNHILSYIPTIDWSNTTTEVNMFETTIRYMGGMLSAYDLLKGPLAHLATDQSKVDALLEQSVHLANNMSYAFLETPTGIPYNNLNFTTHSTNGGDADGNANLAQAGSLILEWTRLSDLTGNTTYAALTAKAESYLLAPTPSSSEPFPGLVGRSISPQTGEFQDIFGGWIGGADSFYEYLIKMYVYDPMRFPHLRDRWILAADSTMKFLSSHPFTRPDLTFLAAFSGTTTVPLAPHLGCFAGGNFILGGQILGERKYIDYGLDLVAGCRATYAATRSHIGPEVWWWSVDWTTRAPANQTAFYEKNGFWIEPDDGSYNLRPEVIESYYYAYRATGDTKYQDWAWEAFVAINATTRSESGYTAVQDVNPPWGKPNVVSDMQESYWFAETLKYSYLIQAEEAEWSVAGGGRDKWVFNTEAHPVRVVNGTGR